LKQQNWDRVLLSEMEHYSEFLSDDETYDFELDMETNQYDQWVDKYPNHKHGILAALVHFNGLSEKTVSEFLTLGVDINHVYAPSQLDGGDTLLTRACLKCDADAVTWLLRLGADPNAESADGRTPFISTIISNHKDEPEAVLAILEKLADAGADTTIPKKWEYVRWESHYNSDAINKYMWTKTEWDEMRERYTSYVDIEDVFDEAIEREDFDFFVFSLQMYQGCPEGLVSRLAWIDKCDNFLQALLSFGADAKENNGTPLWNAVVEGQKRKYDLLKRYTTKWDIVFQDEEQEKRFDDCLSAMV
jgi:hypothetical protein